MTEHEPKGPYVYQLFGPLSHPAHAANARLWAVGGLSPLATINGLTKWEAETIADVLRKPQNVLES